MAPLRYAAKFDPFLCPHALHPDAIQGKERIKFCHLATLHIISGRRHLSGGLLRVHLPGDAGVLGGLLPGAGQPQDQRAPHERRVGRAAAVRSGPGTLFSAVVRLTLKSRDFTMVGVAKGTSEQLSAS